MKRTLPLKVRQGDLLSPFHRLGMSFIDKCVSISRFARSHIHNSLVSLLHRAHFDPCLDVFLSSKLKHFLSLSVLDDGFLLGCCYLDFMRSTNGAASKLDPLSNQRKSIDCRIFRCQHFAFEYMSHYKAFLILEEIQVLQKRLTSRHGFLRSSDLHKYTFDTEQLKILLEGHVT